MDDFFYDLGTAVAQFAVTLHAIVRRGIALVVKRVTEQFTSAGE